MTTTRIDPRRHHAVLFDLDGVLTDTASVHAAAWQRLFDRYLADRPPSPLEDHRAFTAADYRQHVDGKPRVDGVLDFLRSRGIRLPRGASSDPAGRETGHGLGRLKDRYFHDALETGGVAVFDDAVALVESLRRHDIHTAVISGSRNCALVLDRAGIADLFDVRVDGVLAEELHLPGKPDPAVFLEAARRLDTPPSRCVVVEDAQSGVHAARSGGFALVLGVARAGPPSRLLDAGADTVVATLADVAVAKSDELLLSEVPDALTHWADIADRLRGRRPVLLLDFEGTLAPIRQDPSRVTLPLRTRVVLQLLARHCPVVISSGRDLRDLRRRVRVARAWYAGSHGFELLAPGGEPIAHHAAETALPDLGEAERLLAIEVGSVPGVLVDRTRFALAVHYRNARPAEVDQVISVVRRIGDERLTLRVAYGRRVVELLPNTYWNKGRALRWLMDEAGLTHSAVTPVFAGDDRTDEDAFHEIHDDGIGIVVLGGEHGDRLTWAHYRVDGPRSLCTLLTHVTSLLRGSTTGRPP
ncbi:hypothetical protein GCM10011581_31640 [Saccharopolyspora subtropica]|uniref:Trehalose 6-phosphate phosphatase n=1 Tax=Saccharopolyspora thermophila TaxID=89367 RepID=A0A917JYZ6_9PSEU|nr:trehalose-phosphatase [Saccharopolyspora subtropica]GGI92185.1 hypothetical protein GCM10011581_31640 [Saccharopolyspora subtropica]